jgi:hypothetical protein
VAETLYTDTTVLLYFDMWDKTVSEEKPEYRPHDAWLSTAEVDEITLTIRKPGEAADEVQTLSDGDITYTGTVGRWQAHFDIDGGAGSYAAIFKGVTNDGHVEVDVRKLRAKAWPA